MRSGIVLDCVALHTWIRRSNLLFLTSEVGDGTNPTLQLTVHSQRSQHTVVIYWRPKAFYFLQSMIITYCFGLD